MKKTVKRLLPDSIYYQLRKLKQKLFIPATDEWQVYTRKLFKKNIGPCLPQKPFKNDLIMFWSPMASWPHMLLEYAIATNLRLRGYQVLFCVCDGNLPHCEMERMRSMRPGCDQCWSQTSETMKTFSLPYVKLSEWISTTEITKLSDYIHSLNEEDRQNLVRDHVEIGPFSFQYLTAYFNGPLLNYGEKEQEIFYRILAGNIIYLEYAKRIINHYSPLTVMMLDGNLCQTYPGFHVFRQKEIRVITWDDYPPYQDSFLIQQNKSIDDGSMDQAVWEKIKKEPLSEAQERFLDQFMEDWVCGRTTDIVYHPSPEKDIDSIYLKLRLNRRKKTLLALTNVIWDSTVIGQNIGFQNMMDWVYSLVDWFIDHQEAQLIIRVHPAEKRFPSQYRTVNGVAGMVYARYGEKLQCGNIVIVDSDDDIFSYTLAEMAQGVSVYASTIALELAIKGICSWVAGKAFYRNRGFTIDLKDREHLYDLLNKDVWDRNLTEERVVLARRYLYARVARQITRVPFLERHQTAYTRPYFKDLNFMKPGHDPLIDNLADRFLDGKPIMDIPRHTKAVVLHNRNK
jgi:hypothetical protein